MGRYIAKRLSEFVSNAGNTLCKGIGEILERTLAERRDHGGLSKSSGPRPVPRSIRSARRALRQLREGIWLDENPTDN